MSPDFSVDHFALFGLPPVFGLEVTQLDAAYRDIQREVHPDRFANASDAEKRLAAQWATRVNEAYRTLKSPLNRGRYLLAIKGVDTEEESNTAMPRDFLMQQMDWREAVVDAKLDRNADALDTLAGAMRAETKVLFAQLEAQLGGERFTDASVTVRKLRFLEKLGEEIDLASEALES